MFLWSRRVHCFSGVLFRCWEPNHASWYEERDRVWTCRSGHAKELGQLVSSWCTVTSCLKCNQQTFMVLKGLHFEAVLGEICEDEPSAPVTFVGILWWLDGISLVRQHDCGYIYKLSYIRRVLQGFWSFPLVPSSGRKVSSVSFSGSI